MSDNTFTLKDDGAAILFNKDMTTELVLPKMSDDETVDFSDNQNIFIAMAISAAMHDPEFRELIGKKLDVMFAKIEASDEVVPSCDSPEGGCGGCSCG